MTDTRLHNKQEFMALLGSRESWTAELDFDDYQLVQGQLLRVRDFGISYARAKTIADEAEEAFWQCLKQNAAAQRLVVGLDTIEKLAINSSSWMMRKKLIDDADRAFQTQRWLIEHIKQGDLANVTIILAGRGDVRPGQESYFDLLKNDHELKRSADLYPIELEPLTSAETRAYFEVLLRDWTQKASTASSSEDNSSLIAMALRALLNTSERLEVLHYFTGGQPIRLALYTDILITGRTVPEPLSQPNLAAARTLVGDDSNLEAYRRKIELECARQLFHQGTDLRGRILQMLVRATRGLNEEHIHFYLDTKNDLDPRNWVSNQSRLKELRAQLQELQSLTIVKIKPDGRVGLQDEVYRIYSQSMAENPSDRKSETASRKQLYERLASLARFKLNTLKKQRATFTRDDLDNILIEKAAEALETRLPDLDSLDEKERNRINEEIFIQELEALYFAMRLDPNNFNTMFFDFANQQVKGGDSSKFNVLQSEAWLALEDQPTLSFVDALPNPSAAERDESPIAVLLRAAQIYDATGWLIRFFMRHDYARVVELADSIDAVVTTMPPGNEKHGWNHTLSRAERGLWRGFALIYMSPGTEIITELERLQAFEKDLIQLVRKDQYTVVFADRGLNGERGFHGHGAEERALYTLMLLQNVIGYGHITLGEDEAAIKAYVKSLQYNRLVRSSDNVHEATVRNNLARALAERGKKRSIRICRDALDLRIQKGDLVPIAYSFNTLGLILNDLYQAEEAYENCARALAIARRTQEPRLTGLVLIQLAEALRRMAKSQRSSRSRAEELYRTAENALKQAMEIFQKSSAKG
ncbi:MAG: tetratricopeptide repeat protein, partial [Anaerolineae bacterium]|nr:tetratricopeptide repeat protein [Anaerolineae bacterium]